MRETIARLREREEGFTLAELLVVVAIIAVLVAIAIPVFSAQLTRAEIATDQANVRSLYAELQSRALSGEDVSSAQNTPDGDTNIQFSDGQTYTLKNAKAVYTVEVNGNKVKVTYDADKDGTSTDDDMVFGDRTAS